MTDGPPIASALAAFVSTTQFDDIPVDGVHAARRCLLDYVGSAIRGSVEPPGRMAQRVVQTLGAGTDASLFPDGKAASVLGAAFANGVSGHIVELDDLHNPSTFHPAAPIIPAILAVGQATRATGRDLIRAIVLGYEVGIRVAEAVNPTHYRYWHPTGTCGVFGAAAGVSALLGLDANQTSHALGSAGTQASGLWAFIDEGAMSKHLHTGRAAENGVVAAYLAAKGFTGAHRIVESPRGFVAATTAGADPSKAIDGLGAGRLKILENGFKIHACCGHTHTALDLAIALGERIPSEHIERVRVGTYQVAVDVAGIENPQTAYEARFSLRFTTALGITTGMAGLDSFSDASIRDPQVRDLMSRIDIAVEPELTRKYPQEWGCRLDVLTVDGERVSATTSHPRGMPANPLDDVALETKFLTLVESVVDRQTARDVANAIWRLPDGDVEAIFQPLRVHQEARGVGTNS